MHSKLRTKNRGDGKDVRVKFIAGVSRERGGGLVFRGGGGGGGVRPAGGGGLRFGLFFFHGNKSTLIYIFRGVSIPGRFIRGEVLCWGTLCYNTRSQRQHKNIMRYMVILPRLNT